MRTLLISISLLLLVGCTSTLTRRELNERQNIGDFYTPMGSGMHHQVIWYMGAKNGFDYYHATWANDAGTEQEQTFRVATGPSGESFAYTNDRAKWRRLPGSTTKPLPKLPEPSTQPYDPKALHL